MVRLAVALLHINFRKPESVALRKVIKRRVVDELVDLMEVDVDNVVCHGRPGLISLEHCTM